MNPFEATQTALDLFSGNPSPHWQKLNKQEKAALQRQLNLVTRWHRSAGITGFGMGPKVVNGQACKTHCCRIYVDQKRIRSSVKRNDFIPTEIMLEGIDSPIVLDVVQLSPPIHSALTDRQRPVFPGISVGECSSGKTGTIGAVVRKKNDPVNRYLLSAAHVMAVSGLAPKGSAIIQPGRFHGGTCPAYTIARLDEMAPLALGDGYPNTADAALAKLNPGVEVGPGLHPCTHFASRNELVEENTVFYKIGCMTAKMSVILKEMHFRCSFKHPLKNGRYALLGFRNLLMYSGAALDGDSGGPLLTQDGALIGIHIGFAESMGVGMPVWALPEEWNLQLEGI